MLLNAKQAGAKNLYSQYIVYSNYEILHCVQDDIFLFCLLFLSKK